MRLKPLFAPCVERHLRAIVSEADSEAVASVGRSSID